MEIIKLQPPLVLSRDGSEEDNHPKHYTTTLYDENGKLVDDGLLDTDNERSYWESFIDPQQAKELERRLAILESPDYIPGTMDWEPMEVLNGDANEGEG